MLLKIKSYRITKKGNYAFQTKFGEMFLNPGDAKCCKRFKKFFPHLDFYINENFDPSLFIGEHCHAYPVLEPIRDPNRIRYELEQAKELKKLNEDSK